MRDEHGEAWWQGRNQCPAWAATGSRNGGQTSSTRCRTTPSMGAACSGNSGARQRRAKPPTRGGRPGELTRMCDPRLLCVSPFGFLWIHHGDRKGVMGQPYSTHFPAFPRLRTSRSVAWGPWAVTRAACPHQGVRLKLIRAGGRSLGGCRTRAPEQPPLPPSPGRDAAAPASRAPWAVMWEGPPGPGRAHSRQKGSNEHTGVCCYFKGLPQGPGPINTQMKRFYECWG